MRKVTIKKEGSHYLVSVGGNGMSLAFSKKEARMKQRQFQRQIHGKR
jgi:hypothetical protein